MTIEEAIAHCYEVANGKDNQYDECKNEHLQLAVMIKIILIKLYLEVSTDIANKSHQTLNFLRF